MRIVMTAAVTQDAGGKRGYIDAVIMPHETRVEIVRAVQGG